MALQGAAKYGMLSAVPAAPSQPFVSTAAANGAVGTTTKQPFLDPSNPELWLVGIAAVTLGLIAVSTSVKVGPFRFDAAAG